MFGKESNTNKDQNLQRNSIRNLISGTENETEKNSQFSNQPRNNLQINKSPQVRIIAKKPISTQNHHIQTNENLQQIFQNLNKPNLNQTPNNDEEEIVVSARQPNPPKQQSFVIPKVLLPDQRNSNSNLQQNVPKNPQFPQINPNIDYQFSPNIQQQLIMPPNLPIFPNSQQNFSQQQQQQNQKQQMPLPQPFIIQMNQHEYQQSPQQAYQANKTINQSIPKKHHHKKVASFIQTNPQQFQFNMQQTYPQQEINQQQPQNKIPIQPNILQNTQNQSLQQPLYQQYFPKQNTKENSKKATIKKKETPVNVSQVSIPQINPSFMKPQNQQPPQQVLPYFMMQNQQSSQPFPQIQKQQQQQTTTSTPKYGFPIPSSQTQEQPTKPKIPVPIPSPIVSFTNKKNSIAAPPPIFCTDEQHRNYGIRCVCGKGKEDCLMVYCEMCGYYLHRHCVNIARVSENKSYYCPFCRGQRIRCKCGENNNYSIPIIQCNVCKLWVHKECENIDYGIIPQNFVCSFCVQEKIQQEQKAKQKALNSDQEIVISSANKETRSTRSQKEKDMKYYNLPYYVLKPEDIGLPNDIIADLNNENRMNVLSSLPDGLFKNMLLNDFNESHISFCNMISKYYHTFATYFFERNHDFWKAFVDTFSGIFQLAKSFVMSQIDLITFKILYKTENSFRTRVASPSNIYPRVEELEHSESIEHYLSTLNCPKLNEFPKPVILTQLKDGRIITSQPIDDGQFIIDLPGFLMHSDEVECDNGIPPNCITVTNKDIVIDVSVSRMSFASKIKRSFHFNCVVKLVRVGGELRCALYGTKPTGPLYEEKNRKGPVILPDHELFLPLDCFLPYPVKKNEWKDKKVRSKNTSTQPSEMMSRSQSDEQIQKEKKGTQKNRKDDKQQKKKVTLPFQLSLLSAFTYDAIPPLPFSLQNPNEKQETKTTTTSEKKKQTFEKRTNPQRRTHKPKEWSD